MISQDWLADQEQKNDSIISISENNTELLYHGVKSTITPRKMIVEEAEKIARERYLFNVNGRGIWFEKNELSGIEMRTKAKEHYIFTISIVDVLGVNYKIIILRDLRSIDAQIVKLGMLLTVLNVVGIILLYLFSFWFAGKAIKPIKESRQKQNEFIAAVSHELKSPLAVLQTNSSALRYKDTDEQEYLITSIENECQRMSRLVQDLLQLASMDAGSWSIQLGKVDVATVAVEIYEMFYDMVRQQGHSFKITISNEELPFIKCDEERIKQVLIILINNALSYTEAGIGIEIAVERKGQAIQLQVIDHGKGLLEEQKKQIFDRFYRADSARHQKGHYGLGLSVAYEIMKLHKGKLYVTDTIGGGCTFVMEFKIEQN